MKKRNLIAIIQARTGSTRLPGKVLLPLRGRSVVAHVVNQVSYAKKINQIIIATTIEQTDDALVDHLNTLSIPVFRGSENDVLDRYYQCAKQQDASDVVRITADCPFIDPEIVDRVIARYLKDTVDYCANIDPPTFPDGLDVEVISFAALEKNWQLAVLQSEREHVMPYVKVHPELFRKSNVTHTENLAQHRWTVDTAEDYEYLKALAHYLPQNEAPVLLNQVLEAIEQLRKEDLALLKINQHIERNEGLRHSLKHDKNIK